MKIFLFYFEMAIKITGSAQNYRVGRVSENKPIFFLGLIDSIMMQCFAEHLPISPNKLNTSVTAIFISSYETY